MTTETYIDIREVRGSRPAAMRPPDPRDAVKPRRVRKAKTHWIREAGEMPPTARHGRTSPLARLPELTPAGPAAEAEPGAAAMAKLRIEFTSEAIKDEETDFTRREESHDETARLTVYALNGILLFMAFPVGMGMLVFNILGGENLRTTAHMIALTGMGMALSMTHTGSAIFASMI